jgi:hypothetical protein
MKEEISWAMENGVVKFSFCCWQGAARFEVLIFQQTLHLLLVDS